MLRLQSECSSRRCQFDDILNAHDFSKTEFCRFEDGSRGALEFGVVIYSHSDVAGFPTQERGFRDLAPFY